MKTVGKLYIVPTPIGNLEDITIRALRILKEVDFILAEDTRTSGKLLKHFGIEKKLIPHHAFNEHKTLRNITGRLSEGAVAALVSDAGTPAVSDPGFLLVRECVRENIDVECLPGATALIPALVNSALPADRFVFEGFLPHKKGRHTLLKILAGETRTMIFYESPFRLVKTLEQMTASFGEDRIACVSRELSKIYEENRRGTLRSLLEYYQDNPPRGEIVLVVSGKEDTEPS